MGMGITLLGWPSDTMSAVALAGPIAAIDVRSATLVVIMLAGSLTAGFFVANPLRRRLAEARAPEPAPPAVADEPERDPEPLPRPRVTWRGSPWSTAPLSGEPGESPRV